jgi:hypothetical protein
MAWASSSTGAPPFLDAQVIPLRVDKPKFGWGWGPYHDCRLHAAVD